MQSPFFFHLLAAATVTVAVSAHPTRPISPGGARRLADTELRRWRSDRHGGQRVSTRAGLPAKISAIYGSLGDVTRWQTTIRSCRPDEQIALEASWIQARNRNAVGRAVEAKWHYLAVALEPNRQWDQSRSCDSQRVQRRGRVHAVVRHGLCSACRHKGRDQSKAALGMLHVCFSYSCVCQPPRRRVSVKHTPLTWMYGGSLRKRSSGPVSTNSRDRIGSLC